MTCTLQTGTYQSHRFLPVSIQMWNQSCTIFNSEFSFIYLFLHFFCLGDCVTCILMNWNCFSYLALRGIFILFALLKSNSGIWLGLTLSQSKGRTWSSNREASNLSCCLGSFLFLFFHNAFVTTLAQKGEREKKTIPLKKFLWIHTYLCHVNIRDVIKDMGRTNSFHLQKWDIIIILSQP